MIYSSRRALTVFSISLMFLLGFGYSFCEAGTVEWTRNFGGANGDEFHSVQQTSDGGYILAGYEMSWGNGDFDGWVVKLDSSGKREWSRNFGGTGSDYFFSVQQTSDGGYILAGYESSWGNGYSDGWVVKLDSSGKRQWSKNFGGTDWDGFYSVQQTSDGGYILAGYEMSWGNGSGDGWVVKLDSSGNRLWSRNFGGASYEEFHSVQQTSDGGYILVGYESSWGNGSADGWVVKLDSSGNREWSRNFGGTDWDDFQSVHEASDGGYILAGYEYSWGNGSADSWVIKLDPSGNRQWVKNFGGVHGDYFYSVEEASDGGYILAGSESSWGNGDYDGWVVKLDSKGNRQWAKNYGGANWDEFHSVHETSDGGYILAGFESSWGNGYSDGWVVKLDSSGNKQWSKNYGGASDDYFYSVQQTSDGGYILAGYELSWGNGLYDGWVVKLDSSGNREWSRNLGGTYGDHLAVVEETSDGGYILAGSEWSWGNGGYDGWVVKLDSSGNRQWVKNFGGDDNDEFNSVQQTSDGGYILAGSESSWGSGIWDGWVVKLDSSGNREWSRNLGGSGTDYFYSVQQTSDGGYILAGSESSWGNGYFDGWVVKLDSSGNREWSRNFGGDGYDYFYSVQQTFDGGYILAGSESSWGNGYSDGWVVKLDSNGNRQWSRNFGGSDADGFYSVQQTSDGGYILAGSESSWGNGYSDGWVVKLDSSGNREWSRNFGGANKEGFYSVQQTSDGDYILAGSESSWGNGSADGWVVKLH